MGLDWMPVCLSVPIFPLETEVDGIVDLSPEPETIRGLTFDYRRSVRNANQIVNTNELNRRKKRWNA
uniref:Uncharacterized protein n=1 Tax=Utricularia reniformis TaxID=192314 RepID=A0A1Y0AZD9_9LAMI|nr:hypothetical protein AEK19_MT0276 [Utricularia reniformis]ART30552.1 hypothetical protein AEK19_MT0276 [Utricularia reniformis]